MSITGPTNQGTYPELPRDRDSLASDAEQSLQPTHPHRPDPSETFLNLDVLEEVARRELPENRDPNSSS